MQNRAWAGRLSLSQLQPTINDAEHPTSGPLFIFASHFDLFAAQLLTLLLIGGRALSCKIHCLKKTTSSSVLQFCSNAMTFFSHPHGLNQVDSRIRFSHSGTFTPFTRSHKQNDNSPIRANTRTMPTFSAYAGKRMCVKLFTK